MKSIIFLILFVYSLSIVVLPFKVRENEESKYAFPIDEKKYSIEKYLSHILNGYEFISQIEVGTPKQKVEVLINFWDDYLAILSHETSLNSYFYSKSTSYKELIENDPECNLKVYYSYTIKEILYLKNKFYDNLNDFISSKDEYSHEYIIIFSKMVPIKNYGPNGEDYVHANAVNIGLLLNTKYNKDHGIYNPFLLEIQEHNYITKQIHFFYYFDEYNNNTNFRNKNSSFDGLIVFGNFPHELYPDKYNPKQLLLTETFLSYSDNSECENIEWGIKFDEVYFENSTKGNKIYNFDILRGVFDHNVEYIFPPFLFTDRIIKFFPSYPVCFEKINTRTFKKDEYNYKQIYCNYTLFQKYLVTFPTLKFKIKDFNETFEFTYKELFKPIYNNKYYLFLLFMKSVYFPEDMAKHPPQWTLGRLFLNKYQFVFDADNKKVGYYNLKNNEIINDTNNDNNKESDTYKESDSDKKEKEKEKEKDKDKEKEVIDENKDKNKIDIAYVVLIVIVHTIIFAAIIVVIYFCMKNSKRRKRANELIDDEYKYDIKENKEEEENKAIN